MGTRVQCPFVNLPETRQTRWGEALTAEKMKKCVWVNPELVAQIEFGIERKQSSETFEVCWTARGQDARTVVKDLVGVRRYRETKPVTVHAQR